MAIPNNYIDKITKDGDSRPICPPAEHVRVENDNFEGESLDDVLDEISESIGEAGKGSVNAVKVGSTPYTPDGDGVVDLSTPFGGKVDKVTGKGLSTNDYTDAEKAAVGKIMNVNPNDVNRATPYRVWVGTQAQLSALSEFEEDVIYLVGRIPSASHSVTKSGIGQHITVSGTDASTQQVDDGGTFTITLSVASGYTMDAVAVIMDGVNITASAYNSSTGVINISNVTGDIVISATATKHIASITVAAGTRSGYTIPLTASVSPADADNVSLAWSIDNTTDFSISGSGTSATLTIKSSAENASVTITCADTNASSGTATGTLQLTGQYYNNPVPITALGNVSYVAGQNVNTYQFSVGVTPSNGNTPAIVWSVVASPANTASIDSSTGLLTITADCSVVVTATAGQLSSSSSSIALTHAADPNAPIVWEDATMEAFMLDKVTHANPNYITIAEAADAPALSGMTAVGASYAFKNIKNNVTKFNEWVYFKKWTAIYFTIWGNLTEVTIPETVDFDSTVFANCAIEHLDIPEGVTTLCHSVAFNVDSTAISASIMGDSFKSFTFPSTLTSVGNEWPKCRSVKVYDFSNTNVESLSVWMQGAAIEIVKFPPAFKSITGDVQLTRYTQNLEYIEFGNSTDGSLLEAIAVNGYNGCVKTKLIIHSTTPPTFSWANTKPAKIYVPDSAVSTYQSAAGFSGFTIDAISNLPADWDTPSSDVQEGGE